MGVVENSDFAKSGDKRIVGILHKYISVGYWLGSEISDADYARTRNTYIGFALFNTRA